MGIFMETIEAMEGTLQALVEMPSIGERDLELFFDAYQLIQKLDQRMDVMLDPPPPMQTRPRPTRSLTLDIPNPGGGKVFIHNQDTRRLTPPEIAGRE